MATQSQTKMEVPAISTGRATITVKGKSPLIQHKFSEKAKKEMADKQQGRARAKKEPKVPLEEFLAALYIRPGQERAVREAVEANKMPPKGAIYMPGLCFKAAMVGAGRFADAKMTEIRGALFVEADPDLRYEEISMREDTVRLGGTTSDLRYRPQLDEWEADLEIEYNKGAISLEEVVNLVNIAGFSQGVGEWRPSSKSGGEFGRFGVTKVKDHKKGA